MPLGGLVPFLLIPAGLIEKFKLTSDAAATVLK